MRKFKILSACGTGVATSTVASETCKRLLADRGITDVEVSECKALEVAARAQIYNPDVIIHTAEVPSEGTENWKKFRVLQFITGFGAEEVADEIAAYLKSLD